MAQTPSNAVALVTEAPKKTSSAAKRFAQMTGAAVLSFGMVGTFALPAYATVDTTVDASMIDGFANVQTLNTAEAENVAPVIAGPEGELDTAAVEAQRKIEEDAKKAEEAKAAAAAGQAPKGFSGTDIPAGAGASGIVNASLAQLGVMQDCTALVEKALRAIGVPAGDLGTQIGEYTGLGGQLVTDGNYAPGDVLIWPGRHVAVYIGNGQAVHGGYGGNQTVVAGAFIDGAPGGVVRF